MCGYVCGRGVCGKGVGSVSVLCVRGGGPC